MNEAEYEFEAMCWDMSAEQESMDEIEAWLTYSKVRENRLRRWAKRLGLRISKSRARKFKVEDRGGWQVLRDGEPIAGEDFSLDISDVEDILSETESRLRNEGAP